MALPISVPRTVTPWDAIGDRRLAGVSAFGFSDDVVVLSPRDGASMQSTRRTAECFAIVRFVSERETMS